MDGFQQTPDGTVEEFCLKYIFTQATLVRFSSNPKILDQSEATPEIIRSGNTKKTTTTTKKTI